MRPKCPECGKLQQYHDTACDPDDLRRHAANRRRNASRRAREDALRSCGLTRAKDSQGRTIWE